MHLPTALSLVTHMNQTNTVYNYLCERGWMKRPSVGKARVLYSNITSLCDPMNCTHKTNNLKNINEYNLLLKIVVAFVYLVHQSVSTCRSIN